jgi:multidrug efflux pump subunit AcrA (membrane-fusion protein)
MAARLTRRRAFGLLAALLIVGALAASVALRASKSGQEPEAPVALEFAVADLAYVEPAALTRRLPVSGSLQPLNQTTVRSKVSGEVRQVTVREGETVKAGQIIVPSTRPTSKPSLPTGSARSSPAVPSSPWPRRRAPRTSCC